MRVKSFPVIELDLNNVLPSLQFRRWVKRFGIRRLGRSLGCNRTTIQKWPSGSSLPPASAARKIIALSSIEPNGDGIPLTYEDLFGPVRVFHSEYRTVEKVEAWQ